MADQFAHDVVFLCHFDGANNATFASEFTGRHTLAFSGAAKLSTARPIYGSAALDALASTNDYVTINGNTADFDPGNGDFTVRVRGKSDSLATTRGLIRSGSGTNNAANIAWQITVTAVNVNCTFSNGSTTYTVSGSSPGAGSNFEVAFERYGDNLYCYVGGTVSGPTALPAGATINSIASTFPPVIGKAAPSTLFWSGMVDDVDFTRAARYQGSSYTPEPNAFTDPHAVTALRPVNFGTPLLAHSVSSLWPVNFGTPAWISATALRPVHFGIPQLQFKVRHLRPVHFGVPLVLTNLIVPVTSLRPVHFGTPVAMVYNFRSDYRVRSLRPVHFGKPTL